MTTITREQLHERARRKVKELEFAITQSAFTSIRDGLNEELKLARIALASLDAEPVAWTSEGALAEVYCGETGVIGPKYIVGDVSLYRHAQPVSVDKEFIPKNLDKALGVVGVALPESKEEFNFQTERWIQRLIDRVIRYADEFKEQPVPVVPDERADFNAWNNEDNLPIAGVGAKNAAWLAWQARASLCGNSALNVPPERPADSSNGDDIEAWFDEGWNACRAAMLQGAEPVSQTYNLPELIEGMEVSIDVSTCDADAGNRYFGTVTEVSELYTAKNGYILLVQDAEPNFDVNGNSPVTPDCWISCSERMPEDTKMLLAFSQGEIVAAYWNWVVNPIDYKKYRAFTYLSGNILDDVTYWMPLPEPPQEVNP